jgi:predicted MFS family arabinose efflux permease
MMTRPTVLPWRLVTAVAGANLLNPLNSSMIAVALLAISAAYGIDIAGATWLVTAFYIGGAIGMPLMGRLADTLGPRLVFWLGLVLVTFSSALAPFAPNLSVLLALRVVLALGTSAAYPAGLAIFRRFLGGARPPAGSLGAISIASSVSAALGPVLGGALVVLGGWQAIFVVNVPVAMIGLVTAARWLPPDSPDDPQSGTRQLRQANVGSLLRNRQIMGIFCQFAAVNVAFYAVFFGLPLWLEAARHYSADATGLLLLPVAGIGVLATPVAARVINRSGPRPALIIGSLSLLAGALLMLVFNDATPLIPLLVVGAVLGIPNAFNNLGLQAALYQSAPAELMGSAGGLFQTFRYCGAIVATLLISAVYGVGATSDRVHVLAAIMAVISIGLTAASIFGSRAIHPIST